MSLSTHLFNSLYQKHTPSESRLKKLLGQLITFSSPGQYPVLARVSEVQNKTLSCIVIPHPFQAQTGCVDTFIQVIPLSISDEKIKYSLLNGKRTTFEAFELKLTKPDSVVGYHLAPEFSFFRQDTFLDSLLKTYQLTQSPSLREIRNLTAKLHHDIPLRRIEPEDYDETRTPLGAVFRDYGPACRHLAALEYSLLVLQGVEVDIVATPKSVALSINESHCFDISCLEGESYLIDPTNNFVIPINRLESELRMMGKPTKYHKNAQKLTWVLGYA